MTIQSAPWPTIYVDADACPVKDEIARVAERHAVPVRMVSDGGVRLSRSPLVSIQIVARGADAADDWIAARAGPSDIVVTSDIPLADRCIKAGSAVIRPNGAEITPDSIGMTLASRNLMSGLRDAGVVSGGPAPFSKRDRSRFLQTLDTVVQRQVRAQS